MKNLLTFVMTAISLFCISVFGAGALNINTPLTANEGNTSVWIFAIIIGAVAVAGIVYFIIQHKNNKK